MADRKAARDQKDGHICTLVRGPTAHVGGLINVAGPRDVEINSKKAAIFADECECTGVGSTPPPKDSIIGGYLKVFINGQPVAREAEKTFSGLITGGSPNTVYGGAVGVLGEAAAQWLLEYLKAQPDIPYGHAADGCFARAHAMKRVMEEQFNISSEKIYIKGDLWPVTGENHEKRGSGVALGPPINWGYHICPIVNGIDKNGNQKKWVFDPALSPNRVLTKAEWVDLAKGPTGSSSSVSELPADNYQPLRSGGFATDPSYSETKTRNKEYSDAVKDGEYSTGDPDVDSKVSPKKSLGHPIIRHPHIP